MPDPAKDATGGKSPPLLKLPEDKRTSDRQASPVRLSAELTLKVRTQMNRIATVRKIGETLPSSVEDTSVDEILQISIQLEEVHKAFLKEHAYFEVSWPAALVDHEYFSNDAFAVEAEECMTARRALAKLKGALAEKIAPTTAPVAAQPSQSQQRLPDISIPSFKGVYEAWPTYRDLFKAVIYDSQRLTDVEKLHYLRLSLEGTPAQLISGLPLTADSLKPSWEMLVDRYENKRLLIQSYLDQLFASSTPVQKNAAALDKLLNTFKEGIKGLQSLGVSQDLGDCVLVYQLSRQLDRQTKEQWETSLGAAREYPRFEKLEQFLTSRARALERIESTTSSGSSAGAASTARRSSTAHLAAAQPARTNTSAGSTEYPCDCCSELTFVSESLIRQLNIPRHHSVILITGIGGGKATQTRGVALLKLRSLRSRSDVIIQAHILQTLTNILPSFNAAPQEWPHLTKLTLADPDFLTPRPVDIIIGADSYGQIIKPNIIKQDTLMPIAQLSIFGWLVLGPVDTSSSASAAVHHASIQEREDALYELLSRFWTQEEVPASNNPELTPDEQRCEEHFQSTVSRDSTGRYTVRLPLISSPDTLGNSYLTAHRCLQSLQRRFSRDDNYRRLYHQFMTEYRDLNHMKKASPVSSQQPQYYLPHHGVLKPDSATTKLRVVFNGSSASTSGRSLNDIMHTGAKLHLDVTDVLLWIRQFRHLVATDITKMYRQINVHEDDWNLQRILWLDELLNEVAYYLTTVTYGTKAAPFLAVRTLLQLVEDEGHNFPLAVPSILQGRYVDDIFGGADTVQQLIKIALQLKNLCRAGGFPLAKWHATHPDVLTAVQAEKDQGSQITFDDCATKILGLRWLPQEDSFAFATRISSHTDHLTKRLVLSEVAQIFDPLGFVSPVVIKAKMLLQELWLHKLQWDEPLPSQLSSRWLIIRKELTSLRKISIPRWYTTWNTSTVEFHGFSDASQLAMAAVVFITVHGSNGTTISLVCSKTKVAPLKRLTIPRLELTAALLLSRLMQYVQATLKLNVTATHLWTDSVVTLTWIKSHASRWKDFVRNRVSQIQELTANAHWKYVPGTSNPADCASRGLSTAQLQSHSLWWTGPPWILTPEAWPSQPALSDELSAHEARPGIALHAAASQPDYHWDLIYRYSTLNKLLKITALCFRFISLLGNHRRKPLDLHSALEEARLFWIKATQAAYFTHEIKMLTANSRLPTAHAFSRLTAYVDAQGIIRVGGRLNQSALAQDSKHQAILPRHSQLSTLIISHAHLRTLHGGTQLTLAHVRQSYWIIGGRAPVKSHILRCVVCARQRGIRAHQLMGQLPLSRVTPSRPFTHTGVDYAGPLTIKTWKGRGAKTYKGWICVFVCFSTSAIHLEVVSDYSSEGFIAAFRRFSARRGIAQTIYSDCGTTFIGADAALKKMFIQSSQEHQRIAHILQQDCTRWEFNPPGAPHMGGKWEAVVKSVKFHLRRTIGETLLTTEELTTLLTQIEAILNSRPLEPLSDDPEDVSALTPGHFLIGGPLTTIPEPSLIDLATSRLSRWQLIQQRVQHFWAQWSAHYLQRQQAISKWHHPNNHIKVGSIVLLTDERSPPCKWPLARVTALHPGKDGLTRVVTLKTATTTLTRPSAKLAILPISTE
ncbi:uncharacterized protein LOC112458103 [Temnothorax curvispinosus]|uniref:Uncharacterized protein LOC112458103 n=1 Tax=Temnothorax curvispinosus TaxID=300111 RepID=A0A6J1Q7C5_9HYME|nr:uncharacterized protein LOC112458103 [Temnothorax curvispinosus]